VEKVAVNYQSLRNKSTDTAHITYTVKIAKDEVNMELLFFIYIKLINLIDLSADNFSQQKARY
jgi:hypothetical protein